jgi:predicted O-methyltransferase YrrM
MHHGWFSIRYARINNIYTHLSFEEKSTLLQLAGHCNGLTYVEIASFVGASSCCIAEESGQQEKARGYLAE